MLIENAMAGTTSAYAENTLTAWIAGLTGWNYLRVRGEYGLVQSLKLLLLELPPRTRRIQRKSPPPAPTLGTTSAYAENTLNELGLL